MTRHKAAGLGWAPPSVVAGALGACTSSPPGAPGGGTEGNEVAAMVAARLGAGIVDRADGQTVSPDLYVASGISGAIQHIAGGCGG